ncbi:unnamed protein product [Urochloa humidicola]
MAASDVARPNKDTAAYVPAAVESSVSRSRAMVGGDRALVRRSPWLMRMKELSTCASEQDLILMLKREIKALEDCKVQPAAAGIGNKRKKVVKRKVRQGLIDCIVLNPHNPWNGYPEEKLGKCPQKFREFYAKEKARIDKVLEYEQALIKQFRTKGYADDYTEVSDNDDEN